MPLNRLVAPLAAALLIGLPQVAAAATLSVDIPGCSQVALSQSGSSYTISCTQAAMTCVAQSSPLSPSGGTTANLSVACTPGATAVSWSASRDCTAPSGGANVGQATVSEIVGGRSCVYTAAATAPGYTGSASAAVVWQGATTSLPPSGCSITRTPTSGAVGTTGGAISMNANCTGGGAVTSWSWRKNTTTGWSTSKSPGDTLPANTASAAVTYTYAVTACSNGACAPEVLTTFTVAGSAPVGFCAQYSDVRFVELTWGGLVDTSGGVGISPGTMLVGRLTVPASATSPQNGPGVISIVEYIDAQAERVMSVSTQPCDFRNWTAGTGSFPARDPSGTSAPMAWATGINPNHQFLLTGDPPGTGSGAKPLFTPGQVYYVNLQTVGFMTGQNTCNANSCNVRITVNAPQ